MTQHETNYDEKIQNLTQRINSKIKQLSDELLWTYSDEVSELIQVIISLTILRERFMRKNLLEKMDSSLKKVIENHPELL